MANEQVLTWEIYHPIKKVWIHLGTKGSVQEALIAAGELPDPFYGTNEKLFQWIEDHDWKFRASFEIIDLKAKTLIHFPNIDTYASIFLNGKKIACSNNAFRPYYFDFTKKVVVGKNEIEVLFTSPINHHAKDFKKSKTKLPAPNDVGKIAIAPYSRKPQYQFGWDWSLRINTIGFWKEVKIIQYSTNKLINQSIQTTSIENDLANLSFEAYFFDYFKGNVNWESKLFGTQKMTPNGSRLQRLIQVQNPRLWWPKGQGNQELYTDVWTFTNENGEIIEKKEVSFGIRKSRLIQEKDAIGTSYIIEVNGRHIFCKGGDYIPQDIFPSRVKDESIVALVNDMADANYNMVRVWGGGYYPDDVFYETCDQKGIMVWQDFMFACAMYPGDSMFLENVRQEFDYQIPRISSHPSVVLFNGNNEVDVAWKNWGFQAKYLIFGKDADKIETAYKKLFQELLPERVSMFSSVPYIHTSPLSNWGKEEFYNHGSQHYWGVWHGKDPIEDFDKKSGRFNAEYGFQSFPQMSSIRSFSNTKDWNLSSEVMKNHQKSYVGNEMIEKQSTRLFGPTTSFEDFVYQSQLTQARAVSIAISSHRIQAPRCMGTLYWQVNDVWPAPTWSSIDYFGNWKALHYQVQRDFKDITIVEKTESLGAERFYLVSSDPNKTEVKVKTKVYSLEGILLFEDFSLFEVKPQTAQLVGENLYAEEFQNSNFVVEFEVFDKESQIRTFTHLRKPKEKAKQETVSIDILFDADKKQGKFILKNSEFLNRLMIFSNLEGLKIHKNLLDLIPGTYEIPFSSITCPKLSDIELKWL